LKPYYRAVAIAITMSVENRICGPIPFIATSLRSAPIAIAAVIKQTTFEVDVLFIHFGGTGI
jgi:hypothetical protein